jgi:hypothetical protein
MRSGGKSGDGQDDSDNFRQLGSFERESDSKYFNFLHMETARTREHEMWALVFAFLSSIKIITRFFWILKSHGSYCFRRYSSHEYLRISELLIPVPCGHSVINQNHQSFFIFGRFFAFF